MFFVLPILTVIGIYVLAAILPAVYLMRYVYRLDTIEKEPAGLLLSLTLWGVAAALVSLVLELFGQKVLSRFIAADNPFYSVALAFFVVAVVEEGAKFYFLKRRTWHDPNFNFRFDGIVYAVFVSLGFAAYENISYVLSYGLSVAVPRALLAIPGHMGFAVFMGVFYGRAKLRERHGNRAGAAASLWGAYLVPVLLHGFYDSCAMSGTVWSTTLFVIFVAVMYLTVIRLIKKEASTDRPV